MVKLLLEKTKIICHRLVDKYINRGKRLTFALNLYQRTKFRLVYVESITFRRHKLDMINPLLSDKILNWSKLKQIEDDILKCI